ncbi:Sry-alpha family protein [Megaselia abdita]
MNELRIVENSMDILILDLKSCQNIIYEGFKNARTSGFTWLGSVCKLFKDFCSKLHTILQLDWPNNDSIEDVCLCLTQITTCVLYLEKTLILEKQYRKILTISRQHFLNRILWCMSRLKTLILGSKIVYPRKDHDFVELMDEALDLIAPYSDFTGGSVTNITEFNAEAMFDSKKVRQVVDFLLGQTLSYANVALSKDKKILGTLCQNVLKECMAFEKTCLLDKNLNESERCLQASLLESSLCHLEDFINESLLRLIFETYLGYRKYSVEKLKELIESPLTLESILDETIADFDVNVDRTTQIGVFAIAFATNSKVKTKVRNVLASLESLDSFLIPSLQANSNHETNQIFIAHFNKEIQDFQNALEEIIDCPAFCRSYIAILQDFIDNFQGSTKVELEDILFKGRIFHRQLEKNFEKLKVERIKYDKFLMMLEECEAISKFYYQVDKSKILKRLKIFKSTLKKIEVEFVALEKKDNNDEAIFPMTSGEVAESIKMFESCGISPQRNSILYQTKNRTDTKVSINELKSVQSSTQKPRKEVKLKSSVKRREYFVVDLIFV